jgi:hypothetical protein
MKMVAASSGFIGGGAMRLRTMRLHWGRYGADYRLAAGVGFRIGACAGFAVYFYWLMQPNVVTNHGLAAYHPPPKAVVNYDLQRMAPAALEERVALPVPESAPEIAVSSVEPKKENNKQEARTAARRDRPARERPTPFWDFASSRSPGFRPWF